MRLDKYLKVSRLIKRRTVAKEISSSDRVLINDKIAKPSKEVNAGDIITIFYGNVTLKIKVLSTPNQISKNDVSSMYEVLEDSKKQ